ncbi:MAG: hypothetical protein A3F67_07450 [Verrucomicrobia bacterium RIFCSPHIGHO2_12_FULL_41_10]|nr:MAG: hypothetical protein A3F67_07450 [Verrucomicrobia bacterium RIFCSPHIGHO2_12_FULL_41_10]
MITSQSDHLIQIVPPKEGGSGRPRIIEVIPHQDFSLDITLSDHQHLKLNMKRFLSSPAYNKLSHIGFFLSVKHDHRTIYWDETHDMHIDQILDFSRTLS